MINNEKNYVKNLSDILDQINYVFLLKNIRGSSDFVDPWYNFGEMEKTLDKLDITYKETIKLLYLGKSVLYQNLISEISKEKIDVMIQSNIWLLEDNYVKTNNLVVLVYEGLKLLTEINPWYSTCIKSNTDVYIGIDSLRLAENISFKKGASVLDLCSGTGIQGIIAARSASKVISVEINEKASKVTQFNISLNNLDDIIELRVGDLYSVLGDEKFDYIYANPPFIPMISDVNYPICGAGGEDGLKILNNILDKLNKFLAPHGEAVIFCQCIGDENEVFFNKKVSNFPDMDKRDIICLIQDRIPLEYQLATLTTLTKLFNPNMDEDSFKNKMNHIYKELEAKYLYSILYQIKKRKNTQGALKVLRLYNNWDLNSHAEFEKQYDIIPNADSYKIKDKNKNIGYLDQEALDIYNAMKEGISVIETADLLYSKYKSKAKYQRFGKPSFVCGILDNCMKMEQLGLIHRI